MRKKEKDFRLKNSAAFFAAFFYYNNFMQIYSDKCFENPIEIISAKGDLKSAFERIEKLKKNITFSDILHMILKNYILKFLINTKNIFQILPNNLEQSLSQ